MVLALGVQDQDSGVSGIISFPEVLFGRLQGLRVCSRAA